MPVRVLHVIQTLGGGGAEKQVCNLLPLLQKDGIHAGVASIYPSGLTREESERLGGAMIDIGGRPRSFAFVPALVQSIRTFRPDIVHTHTHVGKYWGRIAAFMARAPIIVHTEHNPCDPRRGPRDRVFDRLLRDVTTRVVTFLEDQREELARIDGLSPDKIAIIPNGLAQMPSSRADHRARARALLGVGDDDHAVLVVGRMEYQKNMHLAIDACASMPESLRTKTHLYLVGSGGLEEQLRRHAAAAVGIDVHFLGQRKDVGTLLCGADVLLMTSLFEGMPIVFIEAMMAGTPIVTTPWIGARSMLEAGACGFISRGWDPRDVASSLSAALGDDARRQSVAARARQLCEREYNIARVAADHRVLYRNLAAGLRIAV
jgi:glycosyltransferase involved in cell wall biosynthesis